MLTNRSHSPLYLPLLIAVCGILFSVWNALDAASVPCVSAGCTLYQNFSINGYSLWWGGVGIFSLLGLLALTGRAVLGRWLAGLAVLLDCVLLGIMILTLPCVACMVAALLLALSYITFRAATLADTHRSALHHASPLLVLWGALFLLTLGGLARSEVGPWAIQAPEMEDETTARVFFSPSCSACRQLVMGMSEADARKIIYSRTSQENGFLGMPDENVKADIIYICSPNNPTGAAYTRDQLKVWVDYARKNDAIILYDAAYECFISDGDLARSIFEIEGARECAIEICSFSKIAGFTGTRCGYTVVPHELEREGMNINKLWLRRQTTKFNGVPYVVQRAAAAVFTESGMAEIQSNLDYYRRNAKVIADALDECGVWYCGGKNSPYIWLRCPGSMKSWEFFDWLLENCGVVGTPGVGFGECGEGYFRLTAFGDAEKTRVAAEHIKTAIKAL